MPPAVPGPVTTRLATIESSNLRNGSVDDYICGKGATGEGRRQQGSEFVWNVPALSPTQMPSPKKAALQGVGGGCHGDGHDLALGNTDLVSPCGIYAGRAGVPGQKAGSAPRQARQSGGASATEVPDLQSLDELRSEAAAQSDQKTVP